MCLGEESSPLEKKRKPGFNRGAGRGSDVIDVADVADASAFANCSIWSQEVRGRVTHLRGKGGVLVEDTSTPLLRGGSFDGQVGKKKRATVTV